MYANPAAAATSVFNRAAPAPVFFFSFRIVLIHHHAATRQFSAARDGHPAEPAYTRSADDGIDFTNTFVDEALRGQGVADEPARAGLPFAREQHLKVKPSCSFMAGFVQRHRAKYANLLA